MVTLKEPKKSERTKSESPKGENKGSWSKERLERQAERMRQIGRSNKGKNRTGLITPEYIGPDGKKTSSSSSPPSPGDSSREKPGRKGLADPPGGKKPEDGIPPGDKEEPTPRRRPVDPVKFRKAWAHVPKLGYRVLDRLSRVVGWIATAAGQASGLLKPDEKYICQLVPYQEENGTIAAELSEPAAEEYVPQWIWENKLKALFLGIVVFLLAFGDIKKVKKENKDARTKATAGLPGNG
jgi:hypothetical protein